MNLFKTLVSIFFLVGLFALSAQAQDTTIVIQLSIPIISGNNDVEEQTAGQMYINSTDLELTEDGDPQIIGLHFEDINIPIGASINAAYIQFATDEISTSNCNLEIRAEAVSDATAFTAEDYNVSDRTTTNEFTEWAPNNWIVLNAAGAAQQTPDLLTVLQAIVDQTSWTAGNDLNFIISGSGKRTAIAFEANPDLAPRLEIEYSFTVFNGNLEGIFINELMAVNDHIFDEYNEADDWLELYNSNDFSVSLQGIYLSDDANDLTKWQIEAPLYIEPNGFSLFWLDDAPEQGEHHVPFKLSGAGETVFISQLQDGVLVNLDAVTFGEQVPNISYGRDNDGSNDWVLFGETSPNASNNGNGLFLDANLDITPKGGVYSSGQAIVMSTDDPTAVIRYTLDGSIPSANSTQYAAAISLSDPTLLQAALFKPGYAASKIENEYYLIGTDHELPVVQISIAPNYLWDQEEGMYISGNNGELGYCSDDIPRNWNRDWERPVSFRYITPEGEEAFVVNAGMKIGGGCSRAYQMKGLNFFLRDGNSIQYPLFEQLDIEEFKRFKLRASGNDFARTFIRDGSLQAMLYNQVDIDLMAYEPVVTYLNGEYWGVYGMREFFSKHYLANHHNVAKDSLDLLKNPYYYPEVKEGDLTAWDELTDYITNTNLSDNQAYSWVTNKLDVNEFINYHATQIYITNYDWPANNVTVWRDRNDGKFRWMLYDMDLSSGYGLWLPAGVDYNAIGHATNTFGFEWPNGPASTLLFRRMLQNEGFEEEFSQRICTFGQTIFSPERSGYFIDSLQQRITSEVSDIQNTFNNAPAEIQFWNSNPMGGTASNWLSNINDFKDFFEERMPYVLQNFENKFNYSGHFNLTINYDENTNGTVVFHQNEMKIPYQYSGDYFRNVPIRITAIPKEGYHFVRWEETGVTEAIIDFVASSESTLTPIFEDDIVSTNAIDKSNHLLDAFPNPANKSLTIQFQQHPTHLLNLKVYDVLGRVIYQMELTGSANVQEHIIDLKNWEEGVYLLELGMETKRISVVRD